MNDFDRQPVINIDAWINAKDCGASGSEFQTSGKIFKDSSEIKVDAVGDFQIGQWVTVSGCNLHYYGMVYNEKEPFYARNQKLLEDEIELRGLNEGKLWQTFLVHFEKADPVTFKWMAVDPAYQTITHTEPVLSREWSWQGKGIPLNDKWIDLVDGVQMRFKKFDWLLGQSISFHARNRMLAQITEINGNTLVLSSRANMDCSNAVIKHNDQSALQDGLDLAVKERKGFFIPSGHYHLETGLWLKNSSARIEGAHREHTILDISETNTAVFWISGGKEVIIRNLAMTGHTGFLELPSNTSFPTATGYPFWPTANQQMEIKGCAAVNFVNTEFLLFEDLNVSRMASETFYSHGSDRYKNHSYIQSPHEGIEELDNQYTKSCSFHRCNVKDCGFNAFNNNDHAENTNIINCHVERVSNFCENASRFTRIIGNYVLDGCATSVHGGASSKETIGPTQSIISNNVFEGGRLSGGLWVGSSASQVVISNNIFIGYSKESAIMLDAYGLRRAPARSITIIGNNIDMTQIEGNPDNIREGIQVNASNVIIADNHIYVRGIKSEKVTGISLSDYSTNINIHDNIIDNCDCGFRTGYRVFIRDNPRERSGYFEYRHSESEVAEITGGKSFRDKSLPGTWPNTTVYRNWRIQWLTGANKGREMIIENYNQDGRIITLKENADLNAGDRFAIYPAHANWQIHHNTISECTEAVKLDLPYENGINIKDNIIF